MNLRICIIVASLLLAATSVAPSASASHTQSDAVLIVEGTIEGTLDRYGAHWYRIAVPEGKFVHVSYSILAGDSWNRLDLRDSHGTSMRTVSSGGTGAYDPVEDDAWLVVNAFWSANQYTFTVTLVDAPPQNDAGSGKDAGDRQDRALPILPGRIAGSILASAGDIADWYRLDVPAGTVLDIHSAERANVEVVSSTGAQLARIIYYDSSFYVRAYAVLADGEPIFFKITNGEDYSFVIDTSLPSDLSVDAIMVRDVALRTQAGDTDHSLQKEVTIIVSNAGQGPSRTASLQVSTKNEGFTSSRIIGVQGLQLAPGEQETLVLPWDTIGQAGDVTVVAELTGEFDVDADNNVAESETFILVGGLARGVDLLNHDVRTGNADLRVEYGSQRIGVTTPAGFVGFQGGTLTVG